MSKRKEIVVVGDKAVGKTKLIHALMKAPFNDDYMPTVTDEFEYKKGDTNLKLVDTAGSDDYEKLRSISFVHATIFLIVFSIDHKRSFDKVDQWLGDPLESSITVRSSSSAPVILVGTKGDLRESDKDKVVITKEQAEEKAKQVNALCYVECSSKTGKGIDEIWKQALESINSDDKKGRAKKVSSENLPFEEGTLIVTAYKATNLRVGDSNGFSDPFVIVGTWSKKKNFKALAKGKIIKKTLNPVWNEDIQVKLKARNLKGTEGLAIHVMDYDMIGSDDFLGELRFHWDNVKEIGKKTLTLNEETGKKKVGVSGELTFEVKFIKK